MSEKQPGVFDAAIECINETAFKLGKSYGEGKVNPEKVLREMEELNAAHRVLEAAGKVDIRSAQFFIDGAANFGEGLSVINSDSSRYLYQTGEKQIRALLESLPDEEQK